MALAANTVFEVRQTGDDLNGGAFVSGGAGTDYSQQDTAQWEGSDGIASNANSNFQSVGAGFTSAVVDNTIQIATGTNFIAGFYRVTAYVDPDNITLDRTPASGVSATDAQWKIGGALATPGKATGAMVAGNDAYILGGTYTVTSTSSNVSNGVMTPPAGAAGTNNTRIFGRGSTRSDTSTKPIIKADGTITSFTLFTSGGNGIQVENIEFDGNSRSSSRGMSIASHGVLVRQCVFKNFTNRAIVGGTSSHISDCYATGCTTQAAFDGGRYSYCSAISNSISGFRNVSAARGCISAKNSGASSDGFNDIPNDVGIDGCTSYQNGRHGFFVSNTGSFPIILYNCYAEANGGYGFSGTATPHEMTKLINCAAYNNTSGSVLTTSIPADSQTGFITPTGSAFVDASANNFALNNTSGGGAALRAAGFPSTYAGLSTSNYIDIGAAQAQPQSGGVSAARIVNGV